MAFSTSTLDSYSAILADYGDTYLNHEDGSLWVKRDTFQSILAHGHGGGRGVPPQGYPAIVYRSDHG